LADRDLPMDEDTEVIGLLLIRSWCPHICLHRVEECFPVDGGEGKGQQLCDSLFISSVGMVFSPCSEARDAVRRHSCRVSLRVLACEAQEGLRQLSSAAKCSRGARVSINSSAPDAPQWEIDVFLVR
jgi:hypothetical protein